MSFSQRRLQPVHVPSRVCNELIVPGKPWIRAISRTVQSLSGRRNSSIIQGLIVAFRVWQVDMRGPVSCELASLRMSKNFLYEGEHAL